MGAASYVAALFIGACEAMADFAGVVRHRRRPRAAGRTRPPRRGATAEAVLWNESGGYYRLDTGGPFSTALLADALCGTALRARGTCSLTSSTANAWRRI